MYHNFFIHSSINRHPDYFHVLTVVNGAAVNIGVHVSFCIMVLLGYMLSSGIAAWYGSFIPSFLMNLHTVLHRGCISLQSHQQCKNIPFSPHPLQHLLFLVFDDSHLTCVRWYLIVVLTCISVIMSDVEHLFMYLFIICMSSLEKCLFRLFPTLWLGCLFFWYWVVWAACIFWKLILCQLFHLLLFSPILKVVLSHCL